MPVTAIPAKRRDCALAAPSELGHLPALSAGTGIYIAHIVIVPGCACTVARCQRTNSCTPECWQQQVHDAVVQQDACRNRVQCPLQCSAQFHNRGHMICLCWTFRTHVLCLGQARYVTAQAAMPLPLLRTAAPHQVTNALQLHCNVPAEWATMGVPASPELPWTLGCRRNPGPGQLLCRTQLDICEIKSGVSERGACWSVISTASQPQLVPQHHRTHGATRLQMRQTQSRTDADRGDEDEDQRKQRILEAAVPGLQECARQ
jgi:hypothetical protein